MVKNGEKPIHVYDNDMIELKEKEKDENIQRLSMDHQHVNYHDNNQIMSYQRIKYLKGLAKSNELPNQLSNNPETIQKERRRRRSLTLTNTNTQIDSRDKKSKNSKENKGSHDTEKIQTFNENDTTALENEIIRNEKQYQILINDTSLLEEEIIRNERLWRKYIVNCPTNQPDSNCNKHKKDENNNNKKDSKDNNNQNNNTPNNNDNNSDNRNNNSRDDEKKDDKNDDKKDKDDDDKDDKNENKADEKEYDMNKLKKKIKLVKENAIYKRIQNSVKYALNENELMAIVYYCDSESACRKMKMAHRCIIKDIYWQETYYHCTNAIENIYKVLHYKNKQFKQTNDMSQKLYHGTQEIQLNGYDKDQFFFKTITSFSTNNNIAQGFTNGSGFVFIIDKAFEGLYNGDLRGANVQWLSNFDEYEYVILPTTYNNIKESKQHGLLVNPMQNVYITSYFKTNNDPLKPHSDTVATIMNISYSQFDGTNNTDQNYSQKMEHKYDSDFSIRQRRQHRRDVKLCHVINCEFENADTIPSKQLDIRVFDEAELQHIYQCHPYFYKRLTICTNTTENDMNKNVQWDEIPLYFMQITYVDTDLFHLKITSKEASNKRKKLFIKDIDEKNGCGNKFDEVTRISGSAEVCIQTDEEHNGLHLLGLYENKHGNKTISNSNTIHVMIETDDNQIPPENTTYKPQCINLETLIFVKDEQNGRVNVYWNTPLETYGEISYKIVNHINETERETISILPYSIQLYYAFLPFKVCTIATIDGKVYESAPSQSIFICRNDHKDSGNDMKELKQK